jgi:hypothetical protein
VTSADARRGALDAVERILNRGGDADDVLRAVVTTLRERLGYRWVGIRFVEGDTLQLGPSAGEPGAAAEEQVHPVAFEGRRVAELAATGVGAGDETLLERVAVLISPYCLVGWDTGGESWEP